MKISQLFDRLLPLQLERPVPAPLGDLLLKMSITAYSPDRVARGIPRNVLMGCKREVVAIPGAKSSASTREGNPIYAKAPDSLGGRRYRVVDNRGVRRDVWNSMLSDQKRKHAGRWFSGKVAV